MGFLKPLLSIAVLILKNWFENNNEKKKIQEEAIQEAKKLLKKKDYKELTSVLNKYKAQK